MAVYTVLEREDIIRFIEPFGIGDLLDYQGIAAGTENTNYLVTVDQANVINEEHTAPTRQFVLTVFEHIAPQELHFYADFTTLLNRHQLPVPCPLADADGNALQSIAGKPALLVPKIDGTHPTQPTAAQCQEIGLAMANIHLCCLKLALTHPSIRNLDWLQHCADRLRPSLATEDQLLLEEIPRFRQRVARHPTLPQAIIHGDLFCDNALFTDDQLMGIIDFNSAGTGYLLMDLAVTVNDWCSDAQGRLQQPLYDAMLNAYNDTRPLSLDEKSLWNDFLRIAAARFWISRVDAQLNPHPSGQLGEHKDPARYKTILLRRIEEGVTI